MSVESVIFMALALLAVGFILKAAAGGSSQQKSAKHKEQMSQIRVRLKLSEKQLEELEKEIERLIEKGQLIEAVKHVRGKTSLDLRDSKAIVDWVKDGKTLKIFLSADAESDSNGNHDGTNGKDTGSNSDNRNKLYVNVLSAAQEPHLRDSAPTAEMQAISDVDAMQRAQILVSKGQVIDAVKVLHENAGYDLKKAAETVDAMGKKVYPSD